VGIVWTARISTRDPDAFNITRKSGNPIFAPSWALVRSALDIRQRRPQTVDEWRNYASEYLAEMRWSHVVHRGAWDALLARPRVVVTCFCVDPMRCHRRLLGLVLGRLGADLRGELAAPEREQPDDRELFQLAMELGADPV
jgi:hypothetical protein